MKKFQIISSFLLAAVLIGALYILKPYYSSPRNNTASINMAYSGFAGPAELPRVYMDTTMPVQSGQIINVSSGGNLQTAIDNAQPGDTIVLQAGAVYTGSFVLRNKSNPNNKWIVIKSGGSLPAEGVRVTPSHAGQLAKIQSNSSEATPLQTELGANYYRLVGLEITTGPQATSMNTLLALGDGSSLQNSYTKTAHHLVVDRSYIHGYDTLQNRRCIGLNSNWTAVIDSTVSQCESDGFDTQAIAGWNGAGPYKIVNNFLEGSTETLGFGGADTAISGQNPADIEIRGNYFFRPLSWWSQSPNFDGIPRLEKNIIEVKTGKRILIEGNVLENAWVHAQYGYGFVPWSVNQSGTCTWCETSDLTIRNNIIKNVDSPFTLVSRYNETPSVPMSRLYIANNLMYGKLETQVVSTISVTGVSNVTYVHNTGFANANQWLALYPGNANFIVKDNVGGDSTLAGDRVALINSASGRGTGALDYGSGAGNWTFDHNVLTSVYYTNPLDTYFLPPPNNFYPGTVDKIGFVGGGLNIDSSNANPADFKLSSNSPYKGKASDGSDPGADIDAVLFATRGAVSGIWDGSTPPPIVTPPPTPAPTLSLSASPASITSGQSSTLSWSSTNATSCTASGGWTGTKSTSGTQSVTPTVTTSYSLSCTGSGGTINQSTSVTITTIPTLDTIPPTVSLTAPISGSTLSGLTTLSASASDNAGVIGVQFKIDGTATGVEKTAAPYTLSLDTTTITNGTHSITAAARDAAGNVTTSNAASVTISNIVVNPADTTPPTVSTLEATNITSSSVTVTWTTNEAADGQVQYGTTSTYDSTSSLNSSLSTTHSIKINGLSRNTTYHFQALSKDANGNIGKSTDLTFTTLVKPGRVRNLSAQEI